MLSEFCQRASVCSVFADDVGLVCTADSTDMLRHVLESNLKVMFDWCGCNHFIINFSKTVLMTFNKPHSRNRAALLTIQCDGNIVQCVHDFKYLGLVLDKELKFEEHCNHVQKKIAFKCGQIIKYKRYIDPQLLTIVYKSLVYSHIDYSLP